MSDTGKQSPLGVNLNSSILQNIGFNINPVAAAHFGVSKLNANYSFGSLVQSTCLRLLTWSIHDGYNRGMLSLPTTYNNIITIGQGSIPALGNSKPTTYVVFDPAGRWKGAATTGYSFEGNTNQGQEATWFPYLYASGQPNHSITQWGFIRCWALQAWNEYNWNGIPDMPIPEYKDFTSSVLTGSSFINYSNVAINSFKSGETFLKGTYSTMDNLISADITGVSLATSTFGQDCITAGKIIDLSRISTFGLPSTLLQTIKKYNSMTPALVLAMIASGLSQTDVDEISKGTASYISIQQEQQIYSGFNIILGQDLQNILLPLNCKTPGIGSLADLLDIKKIFPNSYASLTVPVYNTSGVGPAKIAYFIFSGAAVNSTITSSTVSTQVGTFVPAGTPPIVPAGVAASTTFADPVTGFGSYLDGILPKNIAVTAGAFAAAMQQIRNIQSGEFEKFAQIAYSMETTKDLPLTAGTDVPASTTFASKGHYLTAIGSGPVGTFTMSDILGCMSAVPYAWSDLQTRILNLQTTKLANIYQQNFLAVTWEKAKISISQPYWFVITTPFVPNTVSANDTNPAYDNNPTIPNPAYNPALPPGPGNEPSIPNPGYDPFPYLNGSTGAQTTCPTYYSNAGVREVYDWWYRIELIQAEDGGGYGRGTAPNPLIDISPNNVGASGVSSVGRNDSDARSMGGGTFGRVATSLNNGVSYKWMTGDVQQNWNGSALAGKDTTAGSPALPVYPPRPFSWVQANMPKEKVRIQHAPVATLPISGAGAVATNGANSVGDQFADPVLVGNGGLVSSGEQGWPSPMNSDVQAYATQANEEIGRIKTASPAASTGLNTVYDAAGTQLMIEQRARWYAIPPVPAPVRDVWLNLFPTALYVFTDSMPDLALRTEPHMEAQNIEGITAMNTLGGQSGIAMMRQDRNQQRLTELGVELDNNIAGKIDNKVAILNIANGTTPTAVVTGGIPVPTVVSPGPTTVTTEVTTGITTGTTVVPNSPTTPPVVNPVTPPITTANSTQTPLNGTGANYYANDVDDNQPSSIADDTGAFPRQDGRYYRPFDFIKTDSVVFDNRTKLTWEIRTDSGTRSKENRFTYPQALAYVTQVNALALGGFTDWRLPTLTELYGLVSVTKTSTNTHFRFINAADFISRLAIDLTYFTDMHDVDGAESTGQLFWSSTAIGASPCYVNFKFGFADITNPTSFSTFGCSVRLVRGDVGVPNQFTVTDNGLTVTDASTGLMWKRAFEMNSPGNPTTYDQIMNNTSPGDVFTWQIALQRAVADRTAGYTDWRVPNIKELASLVDRTRSDMIVNPAIFPCAAKVPSTAGSINPASPLETDVVFVSSTTATRALTMNRSSLVNPCRFTVAAKDGIIDYTATPTAGNYVWLCRTVIAPVVAQATVAYTMPSQLVLTNTNNQLLSPIPTGYWDPNTEEFKVTTTNLGESTSSVVAVTTGPGPKDTDNAGAVITPSNTSIGGGTADMSVTGITNIGQVSSIGQIINKTETASISNSIPIVVTGSRIPTGLGVPMDIGKASEPGSLAGSPYTNLLPITLNTAYTSSVLSPSTYSVAEAIEQVIICNCDCWVK